MENSRTKQFLHIKLHAILRTMMKSHAAQLCVIQDGNHPSAQSIQAVDCKVAAQVGTGWTGCVIR
jgi:hypothetical protein